MKELDEYRLFEVSRKWKIGIAFGIVFFFLLMSSVFFVMLCLTGLPLGQSGFAKYQDAIVILGMTTAAISTFMWILCRYYRHLYVYPVREESNSGEYKKPTPNKCLICGRHPVSRRYHIRNIHQIKDGEIGTHFGNCGCKYCLKPIPIAMGV